MPSFDREWKSADGSKLRMKSWTPEGKPKGWVIGLHGLNCSVEDWQPLADAMKQAEWGFAAWNLRGQGADPVESRRGAWLDVEGMIDDLEAFVKELPIGDRALYLAGDSMGALLAMHAAAEGRLKDGIEGLMLFVPVVALAQRNPPWVKSVLTFLSRTLPTLRLDPGWFVHRGPGAPRLTRRADRQKAFESSPYRIRKQTLGFLVAMGDLIESTGSVAGKLSAPMAVFSAGHDAFVTERDIRSFLDEIRSEDKTHFHYAQSYHQLLHDLDEREVIADAVAWIEARTPSCKSSGFDPRSDPSRRGDES